MDRVTTRINLIFSVLILTVFLCACDQVGLLTRSMTFAPVSQKPFPGAQISQLNKAYKTAFSHLTRLNTSMRKAMSMQYAVHFSPFFSTGDMHLDRLLYRTTQWKTGVTIVSAPEIYRCFLGLTSQGYYRVQDFYHLQYAESNNENQSSLSIDLKRTEPYTMMHRENVLRFGLTNISTIRQYMHLAHADITGEFVLWYANGQPAITGFYWQGKRQGEWLLYYEAGGRMLSERYSYGVLDGAYEGWHPNGQQAGVGYYHAGKREGEWVLWHDDGTKLQAGVYEEGLRQGFWTYWHSNGQVQQSGSYSQGQRIGLWKWWGLDGQLLREATYNGNEEQQRIGSGTIHAR